MSIFKAYDIRGTYPNELNEDVAYKIGRAFVVFLKTKEVVVGRDMRLSSNKLFDALADGITDQGANVINLGLCSTPMLYFAASKKKAAIMITASHNPAQYNGFKLCKENAIPIGEESGMKDIELLVKKNNFDKGKKGRIIKKDVKKEYQQHVISFAKNIKKLKIVVDAGNGMGGVEAEILEKMGCEIVPMYFELDGSFPNHDANPLEDKNIAELNGLVVQEKADLGIAFDGDADRVMFIDEKGKLVTSDLITGLIAKRILKEHPKSKVLYDLRSSWATKEAIEAAGGKAIMCKVGHAFIKKRMREEKAVFSGELSGHYYFRSNFYTDSGIIAVIKLLEILSEGKKLSELIKPMKKYFASGELNFEVSDKDTVMKRIEKRFDGRNISHLDGVRIEFSDYWFNVRKSNTEPLLRLNIEAKTKEKLEEIKRKIIAEIKKD